MKYEDYPIKYKTSGFIDGNILYEMINRCDADKAVMTSKSYVIYGSLLYPYEKLKLIDVEFDETIKNKQWYLLKNNIPVGKIIIDR